MLRNKMKYILLNKIYTNKHKETYKLPNIMIKNIKKAKLGRN